MGLSTNSIIAIAARPLVKINGRFCCVYRGRFKNRHSITIYMVLACIVGILNIMAFISHFLSPPILGFGHRWILARWCHKMTAFNAGRHGVVLGACGTVTYCVAVAVLKGHWTRPSVSLASAWIVLASAWIVLSLSHVVSHRLGPCVLRRTFHRLRSP